MINALIRTDSASRTRVQDKHGQRTEKKKERKKGGKKNIGRRKIKLNIIKEGEGRQRIVNYIVLCAYCEIYCTSNETFE